MADHDMGRAVAWVCTALLVVLLVFSATGNGTWMGGIAMGWMMAVPAILFVAALYVAYRFGRVDQKVGQMEASKPPRKPGAGP